MTEFSFCGEICQLLFTFCTKTLTIDALHVFSSFTLPWIHTLKISPVVIIQSNSLLRASPGFSQMHIVS